MLAKLLYAVVIVCADAPATPTQTYSLACNPEQSVFTAGFQLYNEGSGMLYSLAI